MKEQLTKIVVFPIIVFLSVSVYASPTLPDLQITKMADVTSVPRGMFLPTRYTLETTVPMLYTTSK